MKKILSTFVFTMWCCLCFATNYYFAAAGSGTGCMIGTPCPLSQVSSHGAAGDSLLFKKGDTFSGLVSYTRSGSSGNPIVWDVYGTATTNPIFDGGGSTSSAVVKITGSFINVNNLVFQNNAFTGHGVFEVSSNHDVNVFNCFWRNGYRGLLTQNSTGNIVITYCYATGISHPNGSGGRASGDGSFLQTDHFSGAGFEAAHCFFYSLPDAGVGDMVSFYISDGTSGSYMLVHDCQFRGGGIDPAGLCQIGMGDTGGSYQNAYNNLLANDPYAGIQVAGGSNIIVNANTIFGARYQFVGGGGSLFGIGIFPAGGFTPSAVTCTNNVIYWRDYNNNVTNWYVDPSLTVSMTTNTAVHTANATSNAILSDPLWSGSPWNTIQYPNFSYPNPTLVLPVNVAIGSQTPTKINISAITHYSVSPALPAGLSISGTTGVISGTPTGTQSATNYVVTGYNTEGTGTYTVSIAITGGSLVAVKGRKFIQL